mgnify:CR=1 FL=1
MNLRGNYVFMFAVQFLSGFLTYYACIQLGLVGVGIGLIPFMLALILVQVKHVADERELALIHKTDSAQGIVVAAAMAIVYLWFPDYNWFYLFVANISIVRGALGVGLFLAN